MYWLPYSALVINLLIIWRMPKRLTVKEIYITWSVVALINLSTDVLLSLYFRLYELNGPGIQLSVHIIEVSLAASFGIIYLNFMPYSLRRFALYTGVWSIFSIVFEYILVKLQFINYIEWEIWYSLPYYIAAFLFLRWHLKFIRRD
jgi:hypothetical protein